MRVLVKTARQNRQKEKTGWVRVLQVLEERMTHRLKLTESFLETKG
jgi:hypothetical protein